MPSPRRRLLAALLCGAGVCAPAAFARAQDQTLLREPVRFGEFSGPAFKATSVAGDARMLAGLREAWVLNRTVALGLAAYWLLTPAEPGGSTQRGLRLGYGGLEIEYLHHPHQLVHWTSQVLIGAGAAWRTGDGPSRPADVVVVLEPAFNVELNIAAEFRISAGFGYRLVTGTTLPGVDNGDLGGVSATVTFKVGEF